MASEKLLERLANLWSVSEGSSRQRSGDYNKPREGRVLENYLWMLAVNAIRYELRLQEREGRPVLTDREVALRYPDIVKRAVTDAEWQKIKPEGWE